MSQNQEEEKDKEAKPPLSMNGPSQAPRSLLQTAANSQSAPADASSTEPPLSSPIPPSPRRASPRKTPAKLRKTPSQQSLTSNAPMGQLHKRASMSSMRGMGNQTPPRSPVSSGRRSSASLFSGLLTRPINDVPSRVISTPSSVAKEYFRRDLDAHATLDTAHTPEVAVVFHDACYGHRFSRPRTSKANLGTIVERPERILAIATGVSAAYILLGDRHSTGSNSPSPTATIGAPPFIVCKSTRSVDITSPAVTNVHGMKWMAELKEMCSMAESRLTQNGKELTRPKDASSADQNKPTLHEGDLYLCAESLAAFEGALGGVLDAVDIAFKSSSPSRVFACVRPPGHHCSDDYPSGFCWLNNVHIGISHAAMEHGLTYAAIFDFDLHHGDGSQSITWAHNSRAISLPKNASLSKKASIGYYSLHDINSYPCEWGDEDKVRNASLCIENAHGQSIWNVHLQPWKTDEDFWKLYEERYSVLITQMRGFLKAQNERFRSMGSAVRPKGAIFISAGFDASEWEGQGMQRHSVNVPTEFYARVTRDIVKLSEEEDLGVDGRVISVLEGGYSDRALASGVLSHMCGLTSSPASKSGPSSLVANGAFTATYPIRYDADWWSPVRLEELERKAKSSDSNPLAAKVRPTNASSYHSPTQSFAAKVVSPPTYQRSVAKSLSRQSSASYERPRTPTPPPPEVDWAVAAYELSQLIVPQDRQTKSCRFEDLNAKAAEARKSRQSTTGVAIPAGSEESFEKGLEKMNLRDKQSKAPQVAEDATRTTTRAASNRRKTFGGAGVLEKDVDRPSSRRLSVTSTDLSVADGTTAEMSTPPPDPISAPKVRAAPKPRAPRKTASKPSTPRATAASKKSVNSALPDGEVNDSRPNGDGAMDDIVSGMKNIRLKLNPPTKPSTVKTEATKPVASKEVKNPIRASRKPPMKKTTSKDSVTHSEAKPSISATTSIQFPERESPSVESADMKLPALKTSDSNTRTNLPQQQVSNVDAIMFNQTPFDPALAEYLSHGESTTAKPSLPSTVPQSNLVQQASNPTPQLPDMVKVSSAAPASNIPLHLMSSITTPRNQNTKHSLPTFTSTSPIPFAPPNLTNPNNKRNQNINTNTIIPTTTSTPSIPQEQEQHTLDTTMQDWPENGDGGNGFGPDHGYDPSSHGKNIYADTAAADISIDIDVDIDMETEAGTGIGIPAHGHTVIKEESRP